MRQQDMSLRYGSRDLVPAEMLLSIHMRFVKNTEGAFEIALSEFCLRKRLSNRDTVGGSSTKA